MDRRVYDEEYKDEKEERKDWKCPLGEASKTDNRDGGREGGGEGPQQW